MTGPSWDLFFLALNPFTLATAILTGSLMGLLTYPFLWRLTSEFWPERWRLPGPWLTFLLTVTSIWPLAIAFYLSQTIAEFLEGYNTWPRILGRGIVFLVYVVAYSAGIALQRRRESKKEV